MEPIIEKSDKSDDAATEIAANISDRGLIMEEIDEYGDLVLHVGLAQPDLKAYKVDSSTLRRASPMFKAMVLGPWIDSKPTNGSQWVVALPEDDPICLKVVLHIIHGQFDKATEVMANGGSLILYELLILRDKYEMSHLLKPWVGTWFDRTIQDTKEKPPHSNLAFIAWELGRYGLFTESCKQLVLLSHISRQGELTFQRQPLAECRLGSLIMAERMKPLWLVMIQALLDFYHGQITCRMTENSTSHCQTPTPASAASLSHSSRYGASLNTSSNLFGSLNTNSNQFGASPKTSSSQRGASPITNNMCDKLILGGMIQATVRKYIPGKVYLLPKDASGIAESVSTLVARLTAIFHHVDTADGHENCAPRFQFSHLQEAIKNFTDPCNQGWEDILLRPEDRERLAKKKKVFM